MLDGGLGTILGSLLIVALQQKTFGPKSSHLSANRSFSWVSEIRIENLMARKIFFLWHDHYTTLLKNITPRGVFRTQWNIYNVSFLRKAPS